MADGRTVDQSNMKNRRRKVGPLVKMRMRDGEGDKRKEKKEELHGDK